jgi:glycosyltransferase involved in cell wall biosynthesis
MGDDTLVSVVVPFLDAEEFIGEAIESVFAQTHAEWELLLVDDGSTDGSSEIARQCASKHPARVRYLQHEGHENRGISATRNLGLAQARGSHVAFLDADDLWLPDKLHEQLTILRWDVGVAMVYGPAERFYPHDVSRPAEIQKLGVPLDRVAYPPSLLSLFLRNQGAVPSPSAILVKRAVVDKIGAFEEKFRGMYEDQAFYAKLCLRAPVFVAGSVWYRRRRHPRAMGPVASARGQYHASRRAFLLWLGEYFERQGVTTPRLWKALRRQLLPYRHPYLWSVLAPAGRAGRRAMRFLRSS